jgi:hypothetical protein
VAPDNEQLQQTKRGIMQVSVQVGRGVNDSRFAAELHC